MSNHPNRNWRAKMGTVGPLKDERLCSEMTQTEAAHSIGAALRSWQEWEAGDAAMHPGLRRLWRHVAGIEKIPFRPFNAKQK